MLHTRKRVQVDLVDVLLHVVCGKIASSMREGCDTRLTTSGNLVMRCASR
ncbi:hypothetical protein BLA6993_00266 [Burkholderia lata]|nr:hypothetical protein BLA6993_00266 [Burkholderia lata]